MDGGRRVVYIFEKRKTDSERENEMAKILVIDEHPSLEKLVSEALFPEGHLVYGVSDGDKVMEVFSSSRWDLILMDLYMNGVERWDLLERLKLHNPPVPILVVSAFEPPLDTHLRKEMDGFIQKDWEMNGLTRHIHEKLSMEANYA